MKSLALYRLALRALPRGRKPDDPLAEILWRHHAVGGTVAVFSGGELTKTVAYGVSRAAPRTPARASTMYRVASISKLVTAALALKLREMGVIDLDADARPLFGGEIEKILSAHGKITLRGLMTHTSGIRDGRAYTLGVARGDRLSDILRGDSFGAPGEFAYSNLGAGMAGAAMARAANVPLDALFHRELFTPLGVTATFFPARASELADARRILPPARQPNYDAAMRAKTPPRDTVDPEQDYALAHGNLIISAPDLAKIGLALCESGYLSAASLADMRAPAASFGARDRHLSEGIGTFVLRDAALFPRALYGHQGLAYGAVHGLFFDPETRAGFALLTSGVSEARAGVLADVNKDMIRAALGGGL